ncbi:TIM barrel protein [Leeia oryzae]|uniref:TIM barrel protein n=1 Tax=Leeia oryzae TaxID=356662 RepID=UPI00035EA740|nr:TIM barrel protein [Leeia oryzae]
MSIKFSLNRMSIPRSTYADFLKVAQNLGVSGIEIRNDLPGVEMNDGSEAADILAATNAAGVEIASINALQRFDQFDDAKKDEAEKLAQYAKACGAKAIVLCPTCDRNDKRSEEKRFEDLVHALKNLGPILEANHLTGLIEPLGFEICALRHKGVAVKAIQASGYENAFKVVHDTFHHYVAGEQAFYPEWTGLIHISGVESAQVERPGMLDMHRVLVNKDDRLGNIPQLQYLLNAGFKGYVSFEPFAEEVASLSVEEAEKQLGESICFIKKGLNLS